MILLKSYVFTACLAVAILLTGCSSHIPAGIIQPVHTAPSIRQVQQKTADYIAEKVRWGGAILHTENKHKASWLSVVAFPLNSNGRPVQSAKSTGRFIAIVDEFIEPLVYASDRQITFSGTVLRTESHKVGEFLYDYPVIKVDQYYLWPPITTLDTNYPPYWWHDPWYDPWYYPAHPHYLRRKAQEK